MMPGISTFKTPDFLGPPPEKHLPKEWAKIRPGKYENVWWYIRQHPGLTYFIDFSERSDGKTFSSLAGLLELYICEGHQFGYVRRFYEDIKSDAMDILFAGLVEKGVISKLSGGQYNSVRHWRSKFYLVKEDKSGQVLDKDVRPFCFTFSLSTSIHKKSLEYPGIKWVLYDEVLTRGSYLPNEWIVFCELVSTIVRTDYSDVGFIMLGNTVNRYCPYFREMGCDRAKNMAKGATDVYRYGDSRLLTVVHRGDKRGSDKGKATDYYFAFDNPQLKMITSGDWEIKPYPLLRETRAFEKRDEVLEFFVDFDGELLHCHVVSSDNSRYIFCHPKTTPIKSPDTDIVYCDYPDTRINYRTGMRRGDKLTQFILQALDANKVFFNSNESGEIFRNFYNWSRNQNFGNA